MIPQAFIDELLSRTNIVEIIGRHVELKRSGSSYKGLCPFHGEKTPSFHVNPVRQRYHCFGCAADGDALRFMTEHLGLDFRTAVGDLAQAAGMPVPDEERSSQDSELAAARRDRQVMIVEALKRAEMHFRRQLKATPKAIRYLEGRGLTGLIAARFGLGYSPESQRSLAAVFPDYDDPLLVESGLVILREDDGDRVRRYDRFRDRIMFPIRSVRGEVLGFGARTISGGEPKYLNSPETPVFVKGRELYGIFEARTAIRKSGFAFVVEGYMDVVALAQAGVENAVATLGTACTPDHLTKLFRFTDSVVFSFDGDAAGRKAAARAMEIALPFATDLRTLRFLFLPPEHDPDSFVRERGAEAFGEAARHAMPLSTQFVERCADACDLATAEGRARMTAQAKPLLALLPEGGLRSQLAREIAIQTKSSEADLDAWLRGSERAGTVGRAGGRGGGHSGGRDGFRTSDRVGEYASRRSMRGGLAAVDWAERIIALLLQRSEWWESLAGPVHERLSLIPGWQGECFVWLDRFVHEHGPQPWPAMRSELRDLPFADRVRALVDGVEMLDEPDFSRLEHALRQFHAQEEEAETERILGRTGRERKR